MKHITLYLLLSLSIVLTACNAGKQKQSVSHREAKNASPKNLNATAILKPQQVIYEQQDPEILQATAVLMQQRVKQEQQDPEFAFLLALRSNDKQTIRQLLKKGVTGSKRYFIKANPLYYAVSTRDIETIKMILNHFPSMITDENSGWSALDRVAGFGDTEILSLLLKDVKKVDLNELLKVTIVGYKWQDRDENLETVKFLVRQGPIDKIDATNTAFTYRRLSIIEYLLKNGVDVNDPNIKIRFNTGYESSIKLLIEHGYKIKDEDMVTSVSMCTPGFFKYMIEKGGNIQATKKYDNVIARAVQHGKTEMVRILIDRGADINSFSGRRKTPIIQTALEQDKNSQKIVKILLDAGVDPTLEIQLNKNTRMNLVEISVSEDRYGATINLDTLILSMIKRKKLSKESLELYMKAQTEKADRRALALLRNLLFLKEYLQKEPLRFQKQFPFKDPLVHDAVEILTEISELVKDIPQNTYTEIKKGVSGFNLTRNIKNVTTLLEKKLVALEAKNLSKKVSSGTQDYRISNKRKEKSDVIRDLLFDMQLNVNSVRSI